MEYREEHRKEALVGTVLLHAALAAVFFFTVFKGPDPPLDALGGDGVELNYGVDEAGSGDIQSLATANDSRNREDSRPPASNPDPQPTPPQPQTAPPVLQQAAEARTVTSEAEESPVTAPPVEKPSPSPREEVKEAPRPVERPRTLYTPKGSANGGGNGVNGSSNAPTGNNNGDRPGSVGDQGDPNGSLDAKALYGQPGSGGSGSSPGSGGLEMSGWAFVNRPTAAALDNNSGFVRFKIKVSADGEVEAVTKVSGNVSAAQERACRDALENAEFRRTNSANGGGTGFYTFRFTVR
ncbi:hypothetical protein [Hymenobacter canadensis]|uniref:TonB C-terminal domain-containing protein n=1 Tax=Hymenobacter canadensis TaxID=2999067 RepID=A0ABY7LRI7_9BACT|nr:hypothetical protein [Hymenobacter canadensis]WBA43037.1 hypothetical protein O3303_05590 [Hymenobacter canadensis]